MGADGRKKDRKGKEERGRKMQQAGCLVEYAM